MRHESAIFELRRIVRFLLQYTWRTAKNSVSRTPKAG